MAAIGAAAHRSASNTATLPPFVLRPHQPTDFSAAPTAIQAVAPADALPRRTTADELRARVGPSTGEPGLDPAADIWVISMCEAGVVAYGDGGLSGEGAVRSHRTECFVHPG